jgi:hypothetical protein
MGVRIILSFDEPPEILKDPLRKLLVTSCVNEDCVQ